MSNRIDVHIAPFPDQLRHAVVITVDGEEAERDVFGSVVDILRHVEGNYIGDVHIHTSHKVIVFLALVGNVEAYGYTTHEVSPAHNMAYDMAVSEEDLDERGYYEGYGSHMHKPGGYGWGRE